MVSSSMIRAQEGQEKDIDSLFNKSSNTLTAVPLIINNPALKTGFGAMGMYFFKFDKNDSISPPATINLSGLYFGVMEAF